MKDKLASPPFTIRINEKNRHPYYIGNVCFVVMTTNYRTGGIYLPPNDRRHFIAWSDLKKEDRDADYWTEYWRWFQSGGDRHVAAFLAERDLSGFNPKAEPPKTEAWHAMVNASRSSEEMELSSVLEKFGGLAATMTMITNEAISQGFYNLAKWLDEPRNYKAAAARLEDAGYIVIRNPDDARGRWRMKQKDGSTKPRVIYGPSLGKSEDERRDMARVLKDLPEPPKREMPF